MHLFIQVVQKSDGFKCKRKGRRHHENRKLPYIMMSQTIIQSKIQGVLYTFCNPTMVNGGTF